MDGNMPPPQRQSDPEIEARVKPVMSRIEAEAERRIARRHSIEQRWLDDLAQYHGRYTDDQIKRIKKVEGSSLFVNLTRPKTNALIARLFDLLFPTDDRNWSIAPSPVPELSHQAETAVQEMQDAQKRLLEIEAQGNAAQTQDQRNAAEMSAQAEEQSISSLAAAHKQLSDVMREARARSDLMADEMDDKMRACLYASAARDAIEDAVKIGSGIMKGPVTSPKGHGRFALQKIAADRDEVAWMLRKTDPMDQPGFFRVDPWGFFPDPDARRPEESDEFYERHLFSARQMRKLSKIPGINVDALRDLLREGPSRGAIPSYLPLLQNATGSGDAQISERFVVWEYTGVLEAKEVAQLAMSAGNDALAKAYGDDDVDPIEELPVRIIYSAGRVLLMAEHPLDSGDPIYSVFNLERDETSMWGYGLPYLMRDPQSAYNAAWRMMLDNGGLSSGPQIMVRKDAVEPENGDWTLHARKIWVVTKDLPPGSDPFRTWNVDSNQGELANIIGLTREHIDEETSLPKIAQGDQSSGMTKTAQGMALLMTSANVVFKRIVKNFDDDMTVPNISRLYQWLMQFSPKDHIKGDYEVDARGSSVLLVREMQAQNMMLLAQAFSADPEYGPMIRKYGLMSQIVKAMSLTVSDTLHTEQEWKQNLSAVGNPAVQAEELRLQGIQMQADMQSQEISQRMAAAELDASVRRDVAEMQRQVAMMALAEKTDLTIEQIQAKLADSNAQREHQERRLAAEIAMTERTGRSSGGSV